MPLKTQSTPARGKTVVTHFLQDLSFNSIQRIKNNPILKANTVYPRQQCVRLMIIYSAFWTKKLMKSLTDSVTEIP